MRHHVAHRKLNKKTPHRKAMFANMASSLIIHDRIETTLPKAKELKRIADKLVTLGKRKTLHARRQALSIIRNKKAVGRLFEEIAARFETRNGGYTRVYKLGNRHGDQAPMAIIEYLSKDGIPQEQAAKPKAKAKSKARPRTEKKVAKKTDKKAAPKKNAAPKKAKKVAKKVTKKTAKKTTSNKKTSKGK